MLEFPELGNRLWKLLLLKRRQKFFSGELRILKCKTLLAQCLTANRRRHIDLVVDKVIGMENVDAVWREQLPHPL